MSWEDILKRTPDYEFGDAPRTDSYFYEELDRPQQKKDAQTMLKEINKLFLLTKKYEPLMYDYAVRVEKIVEEDDDMLREFRKELDKFPVLMADKNNKYNKYINEVIKSLDESIAGRIAFMDAHSMEPPQPTMYLDRLTSALYEDKDKLAERLQ